MLIGALEIESLTQKLVLESSLESVNAVEDLLSRVKEEYSITEDNYNYIWIVLNEAVTNAIKHGNKYDPSKKVGLHVTVKNDRYLCFKVSDQGEGFDPTSIPDPTLPEKISEPNGRGVFLINKLSDTVEFSDHGRVVEMCFDLYKN